MNITKSGLYILIHPFYEHTYKIGCSNDMETRLDSGCYKTMFLPEDIPKLYKLVNVGHFNNYIRFAEKILHNELKKFRICNQRELFKIDNIEVEIKEAIKRVNNKFMMETFKLCDVIKELDDYEHKKCDYNIVDNISNNICIKLRDYQIPVVHKIYNYFKEHDKGILNIPCGWGKTYIVCFYLHYSMLRNENIKICIICPQLMICEEFKKVLNLLGYNEKILMLNSDYVTIGDILNEDISKYQIVITTYVSHEKLKNNAFKMIVYDEAHHIETNNDGLYKKSLELICQYKLFLTATTKTSMLKKDNESFKSYKMKNDKYGDIIFKEELSVSIKNNILCDYIIYVPDSENYCKITLINKLKDDYNRKRIVLFFNSIDSSKQFCEQLIEEKINCEHIDGNMNLKEKNRIIDWFSQDDEQFKILCNVSIINEGISICCIDCIVFMEARYSRIGLYQNIGRSLRLYKNKDISMIVLNNNDMNDYVDLFNCLFDNDSRIKTNWSEKIIMEMNIGNVISEQFEKNFKLIELKRLTFEDKIQICKIYEIKFGLIKGKIKYENVNISIFIRDQFKYYNKKKLSENKLKLLNELNTWKIRIKNYKPPVINPNFDTMINICKKWELINNKVIQYGTEESGIRLGRWIGTQMHNYTHNKLLNNKFIKLNELNTWKTRLINKKNKLTV